MLHDIYNIIRPTFFLFEHERIIIREIVSVVRAVGEANERLTVNGLPVYNSFVRKVSCLQFAV